MVKIERKTMKDGKKKSTVHVLSYGQEDVPQIHLPSFVARARAEREYQRMLRTVDV